MIYHIGKDQINSNDFTKEMEKIIMIKKHDDTNECTAMEIDQSPTDPYKSMNDVHTKTNRDSIGCKEHINKIPKLMKKEKLIVNLKKKIKKKNVTITYNSSYKNIMKSLKKVAILTLITLFFAIILKNCKMFDSSVEYDVNNITDALESLLYGQGDIISKLKTNMNYLDNQQIYIFTGGTGVGKTYAANIISNNFPWKYNIQKIVSLHHHTNFYTETIIKNLARYDFNLLIVDSLKANDETFVIEFVKTLLLLPKKIIVFLIFNIQEMSLEMKTEVDLISTSNNISNAFDTAEINHVLFVFNKLTEENIISCIKYELQKVSDVKNDDNNIQRILKTVNYQYSGCKGVYSKIALLK